MGDDGHRMLPVVMRAKPVNPPGRVATSAEIRKMSPMYKKMHTCWHCKTVYASSDNTTKCERQHEALDPRHP